MLRSPTDVTTAPAATWEEIRHWRKRKREELIQRRMALSAETRQALCGRAMGQLAQAVDLKDYQVLGFCWPMRGEFDVRGLAKRHLAMGGDAAIPVVVERSAPVEFWRWQAGTAMTKGIWDIPIPKERAVVMPDAVLVPLVGFDPCGFRLGYGGGYFDRTLAAARPRPYAIGLGYEDSLLPTIFPQPHDIPMDLIVTDRGIHRLASHAHSAR
jgi:5-formyltetrahydrofolate cyclo-ligase